LTLECLALLRHLQHIYFLWLISRVKY